MTSSRSMSHLMCCALDPARRSTSWGPSASAKPLSSRNCRRRCPVDVWGIRLVRWIRVLNSSEASVGCGQLATRQAGESYKVRRIPGGRVGVVVGRCADSTGRSGYAGQPVPIGAMSRSGGRARRFRAPASASVLAAVIDRAGSQNALQQPWLRRPWPRPANRATRWKPPTADRQGQAAGSDGGAGHPHTGHLHLTPTHWPMRTLTPTTGGRR